MESPTRCSQKNLSVKFIPLLTLSIIITITISYYCRILGISPDSNIEIIHTALHREPNVEFLLPERGMTDDLFPPFKNLESSFL